MSFCQNRILLDRNDNLLWVVIEGPTVMISQLKAILEWSKQFKMERIKKKSALSLEN